MSIFDTSITRIVCCLPTVGSNNSIISTDEDPSLRIESSAIINLRGVSTKLNKYMFTRI